MRVAQSCAAGEGSTILNIDIGVARRNLVDARRRASELFSVKRGAVGLTENFISTDPVKPKELRALREEIRAALERPRRELRGLKWQQTTGTSGTILAIGEALRHARLRLIDRDALEEGAQPSGAEIEFSRLEHFNDEMADMKMKERRSVPGISAQRSEIIVAGGQILEGVMHALEVKSLRTCDWALREGIIINQLRELDAESRPPLPDVADPLLRGVLAVGHRFGDEQTHAHQVTMLAERIFDRGRSPKAQSSTAHLLSADAC